MEQHHLQNITNHESKEQVDVIIVGAGTAGLAAAREILQKHKISVVIVEGNNRIGGRTHTINLSDLPKDYETDIESKCKTKLWVDLGGAWIHGGFGNPVYQLMDDLQLRSLGSGFSSYFFSDDGTRQDILEHDEPLFRSVQRKFNTIMQHIDDQREDLLRSAPTHIKNLSMENCWQKAIQDLKIDPRFTDSSRLEGKLMNYFKSGVEQYDAADFSELVLGYDAGILDHPGEDILIKGGYKKLLDTMLAKSNCQYDIRLNHIVESIERFGDQQQVQVKCQNGVTFLARACLVTVPLGVLQKQKIDFIPPLPKDKFESIMKLGMGLMNKVVMQFPTCFWNENCYSIYHASEKKGRFRWFYNLLPSLKEPILVAFTSADFGREVEELDEKVLVDQTLEVLRSIYGPNIPLPVRTVVTKWGKNQFSFGSYSYLKVGSTTDDIKKVASPVGKTLFFAGEHTSVKYQGCVHGAFASGVAASNSMLQALGLQHNHRMRSDMDK